MITNHESNAGRSVSQVVLMLVVSPAKLGYQQCMEDIKSDD
jgi:hypothetical protein